MGILYSQASFKNSRVASRKPTTHAHTIRETIAAGDYVEILATDVTRTYSTLYNISTSETIRYSYGDIGVNIDTDGMPLLPQIAADLEAPEAIWVKNMGVNAVEVQIDYGQG